MTRDATLRAEESGRGEWLCGLAAWPPPWTPTGTARLLDARAGASAPRVIIEGDASRLPLASVVAQVLRFAQGPVTLDDLVSLLAEVLGIADQPLAERTSDEARDLPSEIPDPGRAVPDRLGDRAFIDVLWQEIQTLPVNQRRALLLNLRDDDGQDVASFLPLVAAATLGDIARCLEWPVETVRTLWPELPIDDQSLAGRLGIARQQVINLRKSARERLARRLRGWRS